MQSKSHHTSHGSVSVVRATFKVYGKMQTLTLSQPKTPGRIESKFCLVVGVHDVITPLKFGDDRFRGFCLAEGQSLHFPYTLKVVLTTLTLPCECDH